MIFCSNCGKKNTEETRRFCKECGQPFEKTALMDSNINVEKETPTPQETLNEKSEIKENLTASEPTYSPPKLHSTKKKWGIIGLALIAILLLIGHFTMKSMLDPKKVIAAMDNDFQKENAEAFLKNFSFDKNTKTDAKGFYNYIEEQSWSTIRTQLLDNAAALQKGNLIDPITTQDNNKLIKITRESVLGGLYHKISFQLVPTHVEVDSTYSNLQFTTEKETTDLQKEKETFIGEFLPGTYKWSAILKSEYGQIPFDGTMKIGDYTEDNKETYALEIEPDFTTIYSNNEDATLFINGKSTGESIYNFGKIGPLPLDGSVTVQAKVTDGAENYETKKVKVKESDITLDFKYISDQQSIAEREEQLSYLVSNHYYSLESFYADYRSAYESDVNNHMYNATANFVVADTALDKEYQGYFDKFVEDGSINTHTNIILDITAVDDNTFKLKTSEDYSFYSHKNIGIDYSFKKTYTIVIFGDSYLIDSVEKKKISQKEYDYN